MLAELEEVPAGRPRRAFAVRCARAVVVSLPLLAGGAGLAGLASVAVLSEHSRAIPGWSPEPVPGSRSGGPRPSNLAAA